MATEGNSTSKKPVVAVFAALFPPAYRGGGTIRAVEALVATCPPGIYPLIVSGAVDLGERVMLDVPRDRWLELPHGEAYYCIASRPGRWFAAMRRLRHRRPDMLYFNSFFSRQFSILPILLWRLGFWGRPKVVLAPRGEFGQAALQRRGLRKRVFIQLFRMLHLHRAVVWHSTAHHETVDILALWGDKARVIERESEAVISHLSRTPEQREDERLRLVFVGRLTEHKGVHVLLEALRAVESPVRLDIYGPEEEEAYVRRCRRIAAELADNMEVRFHGPIAHERVFDVFALADAAVFPTAGENFGHVFAEALSSSCFVLATSYTPWTEVLESGAGRIVAGLDPADWAEEIERLAARDPEDRLSMRSRAGTVYEKWVSQARDPHIWELGLRGGTDGLGGSDAPRRGGA